MELRRDHSTGSFDGDFVVQAEGKKNMSRLFWLMNLCNERMLLYSTLTLQGLAGVLVCTLNMDEFRFADVNNDNVVAIVLCAMIQIIQLGFDVFGMAHLTTRIHDINLGSAWRYYVVFVISFAGRYILLYISSESTFASTFSFAWGQKKLSMMEVVILFLYFSTACQTGVGYGDIAPNQTVSEIMAVIQMLIGIAFSVFIISMTLSRFVDNTLPTAPSSRVGSVMARIKSNETVRWIRRRIRKYLLPTTFLWQLISILILYLSSDYEKTKVQDSAGRNAVIVICFILQGIQCLALLFVSLKFVRRTHQVSLSFLSQSFAAVVLSFAGIYATMYILLKPDIIDDEHQNLPFYFNEDQPPTFGTVILKLTYFSCVTMTTTGFGLIKPQHWATHIAVIVQMLISTLYHIVIFGLGLSRYFNTNKTQAIKWNTNFQRLSADFDNDDVRRRMSSNDSSSMSSLNTLQSSSSSSKDFESKLNSETRKQKRNSTKIGGYQHPPILDPDEEDAIFLDKNNHGFVDSPGLSSL
jgi:hypothetical protein